MNGFISNPIVVVKNGKPYRLIEHMFDCEVENFIAEVWKNGILYKTSKIELNTKFTIDIDLKDVDIVYKNLDGLEIGRFTVSLDKNEIVVVVDEKEELVNKLKDVVRDVMDNPIGTKIEKEHHTELLNRVTIDKEARNYVNSKIRKAIISTNLVNYDDVEEYTYRIYSDFYGLGVIQELDDDLEVGEILVNAIEHPKFQCSIYYYKHGIKRKFNKTFKCIEEVQRVFNKCIEFENKQLNSVENAIVEATTPAKDRINISIPKASNNWSLNIRKFGNFVPDKTMMRRSGTTDDFLEKLFKIIIDGHANIGIGGPMGTGKTTMINYLLTYTDPLSRKVVISSVDETDTDRVLAGHDVVVFNVNEERGFTFSKAMKTSLRTTADRVIIPESRGGEFQEVVEANNKTKGNLFTGHALSDEAFMDACVSMYMAGAKTSVESSIDVKNKLSQSIDLFIIMRKVGGDIRVKSVSEITSKDGVYTGMNMLYYWDYDPESPLVGRYRRTENRMSQALKDRLNEFGVPMSDMVDL